MRTRLFNYCVLFFVCFFGLPFLLQADNKALLETLVRKGYLTEPEAEALKEDVNGEVKLKRPSLRNYPVTISGSIHGQMDMLHTRAHGKESPGDERNFFIRRASITLTVPFDEDWGAVLSPNFAGTNGAANVMTVNSAFIYWNYAKELNFSFGYDGVPFGFEDNLSSSKIKTIERSPATSYFASQLSYTGCRPGIHTQGDLAAYVNGVYYQFSVTSAGDNVTLGGKDLGVKKHSNANAIAFWGQLGYKNKLSNGLNYNIGINAGNLRRQRVTVTDSSSRDTVMGAYGSFNYRNLNVLTEVLSGYFNKAKASGKVAHPLGFLIQPAYQLNDKWEVVAAYSWVSTDGATSSDPKQSPGINPSKLIRRAPEVKGTDDLTFRYGRLQGVYLGGNYYLKGNDIKISAGYEYARARKPYLAGAPKHLDISGLRARLQLCF